MEEIDIKQKGEPVLEKKAIAVQLDQMKSSDVQQIIKDMKATLHNTDDGVAIAAPQIGKSVRIFIIRGSVLGDRADVDNQDKIFINPEIISTSRNTEIVDEGCLSVRDIYGKIKRSTQATVRAFDEEGNEFEMGGSGLIAQIFQHETDHLDGILFTDKATDLKKITHTNDNEE
jgi:peptide deformylase